VLAAAAYFTLLEATTATSLGKGNCSDTPIGSHASSFHTLAHTSKVSSGGAGAQSDVCLSTQGILDAREVTLLGPIGYACCGTRTLNHVRRKCARDS